MYFINFKLFFFPLKKSNFNFKFELLCFKHIFINKIQKTLGFLTKIAIINEVFF